MNIDQTLIGNNIEPLYMQGPNPLETILKLFQSSKTERDFTRLSYYVMFMHNHIREP